MVWSPRTVARFTAPALAALSFSTPANAAVAYLACTVDREDEGVIPYQFAINEERATVNVRGPKGGNGVTYRAAFEADTVTILDERYQYSFVINRVSLRIGMILGFRGMKTYYGQCRVESVPDRAF